MHSFLRRLPNWGEVVLVLAICFGLFLRALDFERNSQGMRILAFTDQDFLGLIVIELLAATSALYILAIRGFRWSEIQLGLTWRDTILGISLFVATLCVMAQVSRIWSAAFDSSMSEYFQPAGSISWSTIALVAVVNPFFEEGFLVAYLTRRLSHHRATTVIVLSTSLRVAIHIYQGALALAFVLPLGLLFATFYWYRRRLWPLVFAHAVIDLIALAQLTAE